MFCSWRRNEFFPYGDVASTIVYLIDFCSRAHVRTRENCRLYINSLSRLSDVCLLKGGYLPAVKHRTAQPDEHADELSVFPC